MQTKHTYPRQFWLMLVGIMISTTGTSMIWPFLMIYVSERLALPYTAIASLMSISAAAGLGASLLAGPLLDRYGRKWIMVFGLLGNGLVYLFYGAAQTYWHFAILMAFSGICGPIFRVATDAMMTDMFEPEARVDAFAFLRMGRNVGVALGPALGGFILSTSYQVGFYLAATALSLYGLLVIFFVKETYQVIATDMANSLKAQLSGYLQAFKDAVFMHLVGAFALMELCAALVWVLLAVYLKTNFGIPEATYGWIPTTNALMVVFLQVLITSRTRRFKPTYVMAGGAFFYTLAMLIIALSSGFWGFWIAMVVMTLGELSVVPTATAYVANLAPADKRGRYMSVYGLTWNVATGLGPLGAGMLSDRFGLRAPWLAGIGVGLLSVLAFLLLNRRQKPAQVPAPQA